MGGGGNKFKYYWIRAFNPHAKIGKSIINPHTQIFSAEGYGLKIGDGCIIGVYKNKYNVGAWSKTKIVLRNNQSNLNIGNNTYVFGANICVLKEIQIGNDCQIGCNVQIMDYNAHLTYACPRGSANQDIPAPVNIGNNVWIGISSIILKGTEIGDHSIVAAGSVVKGKFPPYSLIAGNPARLVKTLDASRFIQQ